MSGTTTYPYPEEDFPYFYNKIWIDPQYTTVEWKREVYLSDSLSAAGGLAVTVLGIARFFVGGYASFVQ